MKVLFSLSEPRHKKPVFAYAKTKAQVSCAVTAQLISAHDCFRCTDSAIPYFLKSEISNFYPSSVAAQAGMCETRSETVEDRFSCVAVLFDKDLNVAIAAVLEVLNFGIIFMAILRLVLVSEFNIMTIVMTISLCMFRKYGDTLT